MSTQNEATPDAQAERDPIRELLAGLPRAVFLGNPPGTVAIWQHKVVEAGGDPDAVLEWVRARGGQRERSYTVSRRFGFRPSEMPGSRHFYVIPEEALG